MLLPVRRLPIVVLLSLGGCERESFEEYQTMCAAMPHREACNAAPGFRPGRPSGAACQWELWVPTSLDGETCVFGEPVGTCYAEGYGDYRIGCTDPAGLSCDGESSVIHRQTENGVELSKQSLGYCESPSSLCTGALDDPPECECGCDPDFPEG